MMDAEEAIRAGLAYLKANDDAPPRRVTIVLNDNEEYLRPYFEPTYEVRRRLPIPKASLSIKEP